jgi:alpha-mannosidase
LCQLWLPFGDEPVQVFDQQGNVLPTQVLPREEIPLNGIGKQRMSYWPHHTPGAQCPGRQEIEWAYIPYQVEAQDIAPFIPTVQGYLFPPVAHMMRAEQGEDRGGDAMLPFTFLNDAVQFSAFKRAYDGDGYVLRFFENQGRRVEAKLHLSGFARAFVSNMNEEILEQLPLVDGNLSLNVAPYKVITLLLRQA